MAKYFLGTTPVRKFSFLTGLIVFFLAGILLMPLSVFAVYNTVQFTEGAQVYLEGSGLTLGVVSGSQVAEMTVGSTNVTFSMESGSSVTVRSSAKKVLTNNLGIQTSCLDTYSQVTLTSDTTQSFTITPSETVCGGGGGGGGAVVTPPAEPTPTPTPAPTETVAGQATVSAAAGGTVEATTEKGTTVSLEMPAGAVTADSAVTITPTETTAATVSVKVAAVPSERNIVGDYVYSFAVEAAGVAVTTFEQSVTVTINYTADQISDLDEDTLTIYYYDESLSRWLALASSVDKVNKKVTATTAHFTLFALMAEEEEEEEEEVVAKPVSEMTISELKAEIVRIAALIAELQVQLTALVGVPDQLIANLKYDDKGDQAELLQTWLAKDTAVYPEGIVSGWFGPLTKSAVIRFQEKYSEDVLAPYGLSQGTGFVGKTTRAKLNTLYSGQ